jgi:hypothetical protein
MALSRRASERSNGDGGVSARLEVRPMRRLIPFVLLSMGTILSLLLLVALHPAFGVRERLVELRRHAPEAVEEEVTT